MRKKVLHLRRQNDGTIISIALTDGTLLQASTDPTSQLPKLNVTCVADTSFKIPDGGFDKLLSLEYTYKDTYAIIEQNNILLVFYKDADQKKFFGR